MITSNLVQLIEQYHPEMIEHIINKSPSDAIAFIMKELDMEVPEDGNLLINLEDKIIRKIKLNNNVKSINEVK